MIIKEFIVWTKKIHLLTIHENINYQYEQKVFIIWDLVRTQKPRQIWIIFLVSIVQTKNKVNNNLIINEISFTFHISIFFP
jgi:hypothetical protein